MYQEFTNSRVRASYNCPMEADTMKTREIPKSHKSRRNFLIYGILLLVCCGFGNKAVGQQTWEIGYPNSGNVVATLDNGTLTISGCGAMQDYPEFGAPWYSLKDEIYVVVIENGITTIGSYVFFSCVNLSDVSIPNSVKDIRHHAFDRCSSLTSVILPENLKSLGGWAFSSTNLTSIDIPKSVISLEREVFGWLDYNGQHILKDVIVHWDTPLIVSVFPNDPFGYYTNVTTINLHVPAGTYSLYAAALVWKDFNIVKSWEIGYPDAVDVIATFNNGTLTITGIGAMQDWDSYAQPWSSVQDEITNVIIEDKVTNIGNLAFEWHTNIETVAIGNNVKTIGNWAFAQCYGLKSITIPNSVKTLECGVFENCSNLASVTLGDGLLYIGKYSFKKTALTSITIPNSVTFIGFQAFCDCEKLKTIEFNSDLEAIGFEAFFGCTGLTEIKCCTLNRPPAMFNSSFNGVNKDIPVHINYEYLNDYQTAPYWSQFTNYQPCVEGIVEVAQDASDLIIYPNPTTGELIIDNEELTIDNAEYSIFNVMGQMVMHGTLPCRDVACRVFTINVVSLPSGMYYLRVAGKAVKFVKE